MAHFKLLSTDDIHNGPVDYSTPIGNTEVWLCSNTVKDHIERRKPAARAFTSNSKHDARWIGKFTAHTDRYPEYVRFARGKSGVWYAQAVYF